MENWTGKFIAGPAILTLINVIPDGLNGKAYSQDPAAIVTSLTASESSLLDLFDTLAAQATGSPRKTKRPLDRRAQQEVLRSTGHPGGRGRQCRRPG